MDGYTLFTAINAAIIRDQCKPESYVTERGGRTLVRYRTSSGEPCMATYACRYPKRRILEIGRDMLKSLGVSETEHPKILEDLGKIYDSENLPERIGCKGSAESKKTLVRNIAIGTGILAAAGVGSYFLFFRG